MKLYQKLLSRHLLFYSIIGLTYTQSTLASVPYEPIPSTRIVNDYNPRRQTKAPQEKTTPVLKVTWEGCKARGYKVLSNINPLNFILPFVSTFLIVHILVDRVIIGQILPNGYQAMYTPRRISRKVFFYEALLFYTLNTIYKLLLTGTLEAILTPFQGYNKTYRFFIVSLSTSFMGICILLPSWWMSLGIVITATVLFSLLLPSPEKKKSTQAYIYTNIIFALLAWLLTRGTWYAFRHLEQCKDFLEICGVNPNSEKQLAALFMSNGNIGLLILWQVFKGHLYIQAPRGNYVLLSQHIQDNAYIQMATKLIKQLIDPFKTIVQYAIENLAFELCKDLLL